jgi:L-amino acid N-acyltransferase YncA
MTRTVRDATPDDAVACAAIYAPYVRETAVPFETEPLDAAEFRGVGWAAGTTWRGPSATSADVGEPTSAIPSGSGTMR